MMIDDTKPKLDFVRQRVSHSALCRNLRVPNPRPSLVDAMPTILSKPTVGAFVLGLALVAGAIRKAGNKAAGGEQKQASSKLFVVRKSGSKDRVGVNGVFMKRMARIIPILVPGPLSMEAFYLVMVAGLMVSVARSCAGSSTHF